MFDKLLGKKRKTTHEAFEIPIKTFVYDSKILPKLGIKEIKDVAHEQDKYINIIVKKVYKLFIIALIC